MCWGWNKAQSIWFPLRAARLLRVCDASIKLRRIHQCQTVNLRKSVALKELNANEARLDPRKGGREV